MHKAISLSAELAEIRNAVEGLASSRMNWRYGEGGQPARPLRMPAG